MRILGIETSCDETAVAVYDATEGLLAHAIYSQGELHAAYGGVVPELASRDHVRKILPLIIAVLQKAGLTIKDIDGIAYTKGPGLAGALLVGAAMGRTLGWALNIPAIGVHHMEAHLLAPFLENQDLKCPLLALLVSGGHTLLVKVNNIGDYEILGESLDDAAGEAFDKTAKLLGLPYPGGPELEKLARQGTPDYFTFPRPLLTKPNLDFSFSGLKTAVANTLKMHNGDEKNKANIARAFQDAVIATLVGKCKRALQQTMLKQLIIAGGVGANGSLRSAMQEMVIEEGAKVFYPRPLFCTDNGAMVAYAGYKRLQLGFVDSSLAIEVKPRWSLSELES